MMAIFKRFCWVPLSHVESYGYFNRIIQVIFEPCCNKTQHNTPIHLGLLDSCWMSVKHAERFSSLWFYCTRLPVRNMLVLPRDLAQRCKQRADQRNCWGRLFLRSPATCACLGRATEYIPSMWLLIFLAHSVWGAAEDVARSFGTHSCIHYMQTYS